VRCALAFVGLAACSIRSVDYTGKACPCPAGYRCDTVSQTCARNTVSAVDAAMPSDGRGDDADTPAVSCIPNPRTKLIDSLPTFATFPQGWALGPGAWSKSGNNAYQSSAVQLAFASRLLQSTSDNYRIVITMQAADAQGGDVGIAFRAAGAQMYNCTFDPRAGDLEMHYSTALSEDLLEVLHVAPLTSGAPFTMEIQSNGTEHRCCVRERPDVLLVVDPSAVFGEPGIVTRDGAGLFSSYAAYE
jgi:hypothetical protein